MLLKRIVMFTCFIALGPIHTPRTFSDIAFLLLELKTSPQEPSQKIWKDACIPRVSKIIMMLMMMIIIMKLSTHLKKRWADFLCEKPAHHWQICVVFTVQSSNHQPLIFVVYYNLFHKTKSRAHSSMSGN